MLDAGLWNNNGEKNILWLIIINDRGNSHCAFPIWRILYECFSSSMSSIQSVPRPVRTVFVCLLSYAQSGLGWHRWAFGRRGCSGSKSSLLLKGSAMPGSFIRFLTLGPIRHPWMCFHPHTHTQEISHHDMFTSVYISHIFTFFKLAVFYSTVQYILLLFICV